MDTSGFSLWTSSGDLTAVELAADTQATARMTNTVVFNKTILSSVRWCWWRMWGCGIVCGQTRTTKQKTAGSVDTGRGHETSDYSTTAHKAIDCDQLSHVTLQSTVQSTVLLRLQQIKRAYKCRILLILTTVVFVTCVLLCKHNV